jgi:hypothetical protein
VTTLPEGGDTAFMPGGIQVGILLSVALIADVITKLDSQERNSICLTCRGLASIRECGAVSRLNGV